MYEDTHRTFLQMIMHAGIMSEYEIQQASGKIFNYNNSASFHIAFLNLKLEPLSMMIKSGCCELTGEKYYALMTTTVDPVTRFQTQFSQAQLELLRKVFNEIIDSPNGSAPSTTCLNFCTSLENHLSKASAEEFLNDLVRRKWLNYDNGHYYMGVRSTIELIPYFRTTYQEGFNNCPLCKQAVFHGRRCEQCQVVAHLYCLATFAKIQKPLKCSNCSNCIPTDDLPEVPEKPMDMNETAGMGSQLSQKRMKRSSKNRSAR